MSSYISSSLKDTYALDQREDIEGIKEDLTKWQTLPDKEFFQTLVKKISLYNSLQLIEDTRSEKISLPTDVEPFQDQIIKYTTDIKSLTTTDIFSTKKSGVRFGKIYKIYSKIVSVRERRIVSESIVESFWIQPCRTEGKASRLIQITEEVLQEGALQLSRPSISELLALQALLDKRVVVLSKGS